MPDLQTEKVTVNAARNEILHLIYNGKDKILNSGLAKGNAVQAQRTTAKMTAVAGFYGEPYYYESGDDSAKVTINAKDGSEINNILQALYNAQFDDASNEVSTFDLMIEQKDKNKKVKLEQCLISNQPNEEMNDGDHVMAWSLLAGKMTTIAQKPSDSDIPWSDGTTANGGGILPTGESVATIQVHYQDDNGQSITGLDDTSVKGNIGEDYAIPTPEISGYTYEKTTVPLNGKLINDQSAVVTYSKNI